MFEEEWKDVPDWNGLYQVSNQGRIRRKFNNGFHYLKGSFNDQHLQVDLYYKEKKERCFLHRLVFSTFVRPLKEEEVVHHSNGNKADNRLQNLEVMDRGVHSSLHNKKIIKTKVNNKINNIIVKQEKRILKEIKSRFTLYENKDI